MANVTIPPKSRAEWSKLISGEIDHKFKNYVLQIRIYQMRKDISMGRLTLDAATTQLYELCCKYSLAVQAVVNLTPTYYDKQDIHQTRGDQPHQRRTHYAPLGQ